MSNADVLTESLTKLLIWITGVDGSDSVNDYRVVEVSYKKYSLLLLPVIQTKPTDDFTQTYLGGVLVV